MKNKIAFSLLVLGISSLTTQIILLREITANFLGNELSIGVVLSLWMIGIGLGSLIFGYLLSRREKNNTLNILASLELITAVLVISSPIVARISKPALGIPHYELIDFHNFIFLAILSILPIAFILGSSFVGLTSVLSNNIKSKVSGIGYSYVIEAAGAGIGGILFSYVLIKFLTHIEIASIIAALNLACFYILSRGMRLKILRISLAAFAFSVIVFANCADNLFEQLRFGNEKLIYSKNSIYGNIAVTKRGNQYCLYSNGSLLFTTEDTEANEEFIHLAMLESPHPKGILLVGGGAGGMLKEILKHSPDNIDYVELDPLLIKSAIENIPILDRKDLQDPKVHVHYVDARYFVKTTLEKYDLIIINTPDPLNIQTNRFFSREFFLEVSRRLNKRGIFCMGISSKEDCLSKEIALYNASVYKTLESVFPEVIFIPSWKLIFFSANQQGILTTSSSILKQRYEQRDLKNLFFSPYHLDYRLDTNKSHIDYLKGALNKYESETSINKDFLPASFFNALNMWLKETSNIKKLPSRSTLRMISLIILILIVLWLMIDKKRLLQGVIFTTGTLGISSEFMILAAFQSIYGFLYYRIGVIIASFMVGLSLGGFIMTRHLQKNEAAYSKLRNLEMALLLYLACLAIILSLVKQAQALWMQILFLMLSAVIGLLVGLEFLLATRINLNKGRKIEETTGVFYACDILGASLGGFLSSLLLFPAFGIYGMIIYLGVFKLATSLLLKKGT